MKFFGDLLSEQITRKIIYLTFSFVLAIVIMGGIEQLSRKIDTEYRFNLENQIGRYDLGRSIINSLLNLELDLEETYDSRDLRSLEISSHRVEHYISDIEGIIKVLRDGGVFSQVLTANFYDIDSFRRDISYHTDPNGGYDLEVLNLTPKIAEIKDITSEVFQILANEIKAGKTYSSFDEHHKMLRMELDALLYRSTESANKIFYEAHKSIEKIKNERKKSLESLNTWRYASIALLSVTCLILFLHIMYRISVILDERKTRLQKLEEANESIETILDSIPVGVILLEADKTIQRINKAALELLEAESINELEEKTCSDLFASVPEKDCPIQDRGKLSHNIEVTLQTVTGKKLPIIKNALPIMLNGRKILLEAFMDISEKNKAEQKVRESQEFIKALFASVPTGIAVIDADNHIILDLNRAAVEMIGAPREELINRTCQNFICPEQIGNCPITDKNLAVDNSERTLIKWNGETIPVLKSAVKTNLNGKCLLIESFTDISKQKDIERRLEEARSAADQANQAKSAFLANMSHEIRTPMNAVIGLSHLMLKTELNFKQKEFSAKILTSANSLLRLLNDILDFSKIEAGKLDLETIAFDPETVILDAFDYIAVESERKRIERIVQLSPDVPDMLQGDPLRLRQVLTNLAGNALKFTEDGEITISCLLKWSDRRTAILEFHVSDTGIGIPEDKLSNLFESFSQADNSITRQYGGTGLGLSISKNLIELMGGSITIESMPGHGTTFIFTVKFDYLTEETDKKYEELTLQKAPILVAHKNREVRRSTLMTLKRLGIRSKEISDISELDTITSATPFDALIMDLSYTEHECDGLKKASSIPGDLKKDHQKLIMTASESETRIHADDIDNSNIEQILTRPFGKKALARAMNAILGYPDITMFEDEYNTGMDFKEMPEAEVLVVEDNSINWSIAKEMLSNMGLNPSWAQNGKVGVSMAQQKNYDLILMDVQMPVMDGYTATKKLRSEPETKDIPIIAMTAHTMNEHRQAVLDSGMNDFISKPIEPDQMYATINKWLSSEKKISPQDHLPNLEDNKKPEKSETKRSETANLHFDLNGALKRTGGVHELIFSLLDHYVENAPTYIAEIKETVKTDNKDLLKMQAHTIRGMAGSIGAVSVMKASALIEDSVGTASTEELVLMVEKLAGVYKISLGHMLLDKYLYEMSTADGETAQTAREKILNFSEIAEVDPHAAVAKLNGNETAKILSETILEVLEVDPEELKILLGEIKERMGV